MNLERTFKKEFSQDERKETAEAIKQARKELKMDWKDWTDEKLDEAPEAIREKRKELKKDFIGQLFKSEKFQKSTELFRTLIQSERAHASEKLLKKYNERFDDILKNIPLSSEEQEKYLSENALIEMNLEDYLTLRKRLSGYYISHVTRYGVREQGFMSTGGGHVVGMGNAMDNFTPLLKDGNIRSFFSNLVNETEYATSVITDQISMIKKYRQEAGEPCERDDIIENLMRLLLESENDEVHVANRSSVHFGENAVLGHYYGSEIGYDIYAYYPAEVIAKNYYHEKDKLVSRTNAHDWYNDIGVWNEHEGIPLDVGVLCIPGNVIVDKETGSQYFLDENKCPEVLPEVAEHIEFFSQNKEFVDSLWNQFTERWRRSEGSISRLHNETHRECDMRLLSFYTSKDFIEIGMRLGFKDTTLFQSFYKWQYNDLSGISSSLKRFYQHEQRNYYRKPERDNLITSEQYWEEYFKQHPEQKPTKVFYGRLGKYEKNDFPEYQDLLNEKRFYQTEDLPEYDEFKEKTVADMRKVIEKVYDETVV